MAPLVLQLVVWALAWSAGVAGLASSVATPVDALRISLAAMFAFTAVAHFVPRTRTEMLAMVPPALPMPGVLVSLAGGLELAGAAGLLLPSWTLWAALCLAALLVAMFPANVHAARAGVAIAGRRAMAIGPRLGVQLFWIACLLWVTAAAFGSRAT